MRDYYPDEPGDDAKAVVWDYINRESTAARRSNAEAAGRAREAARRERSARQWAEFQTIQEIERCLRAVRKCRSRKAIPEAIEALSTLLPSRSSCSRP